MPQATCHIRRGLPLIFDRHPPSGRVDDRDAVGELAAHLLSQLFPRELAVGEGIACGDLLEEGGDVVAVYSDGVTDARNMSEELFDSRDNRRLMKRLAEASGGPEAVGKAILQNVREYSAGHVQVDDITLICFGPVAR